MTHARRAVLGAALVAWPCATVSAQRPVEPFVELSASALTLRDSIVAVARAQIGLRYQAGGATPNHGFDCSGLVNYVLQSLHVDVPRTSTAQARFGGAVERDSTALRPGDLLMFGKVRDGVSHVGIYIGNGRYVHASSVAGRVIESPLNRPALSLVKVLKGVRRALALRDTISVKVAGTVSVVQLAPAPSTQKQKQ